MNGFVASTGASVPARHSRARLATGRYPAVARLLSKDAPRAPDEALERPVAWVLDGARRELERAGVRVGRRR